MRVLRINIIGITISCFCSAFHEKNCKKWLRKLAGTKEFYDSILMQHVQFDMMKNLTK